jgi:hypothetical protein
VDRVLEKMRPFLDEKSRANGFETLGWTEVGFQLRLQRETHRHARRLARHQGLGPGMRPC